MSELTNAYNIAKQSNPNLSLQEFQKSYSYDQPVVSQPTQTQPSPIQADQTKIDQTLNKLGISKIQSMQMENNPVFRKQLLEMTYGDQAKSLPEYQQLAAQDEKRGALGQQVEAYGATAENSMLALEEALRAKGDIGKQALGESELFKKAGLEGFYSLNQSLAENANAMQDRYGSFTNALSRMSQFHNNQYRTLASEFNRVNNTYQEKKDEMNQVLEQAQKMNEAMQLAEMEFDVWKRQQTFLRSLKPGAETVAEWRQKGYEYVNGEFVPADSFDAIFGTVGNPGDKDVGECGYFSNRATNADALGKHVGNTWESKIATADTIVRKDKAGILEADSFNFEAGNTLLIPMGQYGHTAVITNYDPVTGNIQVVERNKNLDGETTSGMYNIYDLQDQYSEWGVAKTGFTDDIQSKMGKINAGGGLNMFNDFTSTLSSDRAQMFSALSNEDQSVIKQMITGDALLTDIVKSRGKEGTNENKRLLQLAQQIDPNFSLNTNKIRFDFKKQWDTDSVKGSVGQRTAINTSLGHLADLSEAAQQLPGGVISKMNDAENVLRTEFGDPSVTNFRIVLNALASELAKTYKGGVPTEAEIKDWQKSLADSFSQSQFEGAFNTTAKLLSSKITASRYLYSKTMGQEYDQSLIDPDKRQMLIDSGINPDVIINENIGANANLFDQKDLDFYNSL
jgi:hypothetical protein